MNVLLYDYWRSSSSYRVRIALNLANIPFESRSVNLLEGKQRAADYLELNPQGFVPTLLIDEQKFTQSLAMLEYLDETGAVKLLPGDPQGRARVRALAYAISMDTHPICNVSVAKHAVEASAGAITTQAWMTFFIERGLTAFEALLDEPATGAFCHGDHVSLADLCLVPQVYNALRWGLDVTRWPQVSRIYGHLEKMPEVAAAHPDNFKP
ncbi:maleylacetoacetate isomerase [Rhizobium sp. 2YAF20]|uniref:maleylacetoacetate isomerase n=1 Tax=Rhizobium sp. 2YAF20 TaxID=3233027 RepID=UPI003F9E2A5A